MKRIVACLIWLLIAGPSVRAQGFLWAKDFVSDSQSDFVAGFLCKDASDNLYTDGSFSGTVDFDPGPGSYTMTGSASKFIQKLDANGNFIWVKRLDVSVRHMATDDMGNIFLTGAFSGTIDFDPGPGTQTLTSIYGPDCYILKLDSSGTFQWVKQIGDGGASDGSQIKPDNNGNIFVVGTYEWTTDLDPGPGIYIDTAAGNRDVFVIKLDAAGDFVWAYVSGTALDDEAYGVDVDVLGNVYVISKEPVVNITKLNSNGTPVWSKQMDGGVSFGRVTIGDNALFVSGIFTGTSDFDPGPGTFSLTSFGMWDIFLLKLDMSGSMVWVKQIGGAGIERATSAIIDGVGNIYLYGDFQSTCDFDPGPQQHNLTAQTDGINDMDLFLLKLDASGDLVWVHQIGSKRDEGVGQCILDSHSNIVAFGSYQDTVDFDPGAGVYQLSTYPYTQNGFLFKWVNPMNVPLISSGNIVLTTFPNPTTGKIYVSCNEIIRQLTVTDVLGRIISLERPQTRKYSVEIDTSPGVYYVTVYSDADRATQKIVLTNE
ncbi:MAG: SBBP repeat-containing protein [Flavipsychrobacter sp.]|nr:SBBP repeat-containing protein [Flavipsychrobacter sp.]